MKLPGLDTRKATTPAMEQFLAERRVRRPVAMTTRERLVDGVAGLLLIGAVAALASGADYKGHIHVVAVALLTLAYAVAARVRFSMGAGWGDASQLVFIPLLFTAPPALVPLLVAAALTLSVLPDALAGRMHRDRVPQHVGQAWFAFGPALVFVIAGVNGPRWSDAPIYLAAFVAQIVADTVISTLREWAAMGIPPRFQVSVLARVYLVDALLTPIGLCAALAADGEAARSLIVLPLIALLAVFAQERETYVQHALELSNAYRGTALLLGDVLEDKDAYTASHSHGVVSLSLMVSDRLRLNPAARRRVEFGALLHDIGKIAVPAEIINKPGPLDDEEWAVMKLHTVEGQTMLDRVGGVLGEVGRVVRSSHEHFDGMGYPDGLAGDEIPIEARVVACCDAFSAMTTTRSYRKAMSLESAREELVRNAGTQFDPKVVTALLDAIHEERVAVIAQPDPEVTPAA